jgi:hypothetical protein
MEKTKERKDKMGCSWNIGTIHCFPMLQVLKEVLAYMGLANKYFSWGGWERGGKHFFGLLVTALLVATTWMDSICMQSILTNFLSVFGGHLICANILHKNKEESCYAYSL